MQSPCEIDQCSISVRHINPLDSDGAGQYDNDVIVGFKSEEARLIFNGFVSRHLPSDIQTVARRKLIMLDAAVYLDGLRVPHGNRLEALKGDRIGRHSIRVHDQWRICFVWQDGNAADIEIVDYPLWEEHGTTIDHSSG